MKRKKRSANALLLVLSLLASLLAPAQANATSDYDNLLHVTPTLYVYTDGGAKTQKMDISTTWWANYKQTDAKRIAQNIGWPTNFVAEFEAIVNSGGSWGVFLREDIYGSVITIVGTHDPHARCGFTGSASSGAYECSSNSGYGYVHATYFTHNSYGGNGCIGSYGDRCSDSGMNAYMSPTVVSGPVTGAFVSLPTSSLSSFKFFYMNFDLEYPVGYEGALIPTDPPPARFAALGDSVSSGHGNPRFEPNTDNVNENECRRSVGAYPRLLQNTLNLGATAFVACSGATTANVLNGGSAKGSWGEPPQISALSDATEMVTITIGGNDVAFEDYALGCVVICGPGTPVYVAMVAGINDDFKANLKTTFETILSEAPGAEIYVLDYAYMSSDDVPGCGPFDLSGARSVQLLLNSKISQAVAEINDPRLHFVPTNYPGSPFEGRHLCTSDPRGSAFDLFTMHPNASGLEAYKEVLTAYLN